MTSFKKPCNLLPWRSKLRITIFFRRAYLYLCMYVYSSLYYVLIINKLEKIVLLKVNSFFKGYIHVSIRIHFILNEYKSCIYYWSQRNEICFLSFYISSSCVHNVFVLFVWVCWCFFYSSLDLVTYRRPRLFRRDIEEGK